jgi:hypothetical protein
MQSIIKLIFTTLVGLSMVMGLLTTVHAEVPSGGFQGGLDAVGEKGDFTQSAIRSDQGILGVIADIISILLSISGAVAVLAIIYGGFLFLTAGGNETQVKTAKQILLYAIIGTVVIILSYVIIDVIVTQSNIATN